MNWLVIIFFISLNAESIVRTHSLEAKVAEIHAELERHKAETERFRAFAESTKPELADKQR